MMTTTTTTTATRPRADPLCPADIEKTLTLLASVRHVLVAVGAGRPIHGTDAPAIRETCRRLGALLTALASKAES